MMLRKDADWDCTVNEEEASGTSLLSTNLKAAVEILSVKDNSRIIYVEAQASCIESYLEVGHSEIKAR